MNVKHHLVVLAAVTAVIGLAATPASAVREPVALGSPPPKAPVAPPPAPDPSVLAEPATVLPSGWQASNDRAIAVTGDMNGLHLLVAEESAGYKWRTAATLADTSFDADQWIGQACVTGSGDRAVVVYAPRTFTNARPGMDGAGLVAVVDLRDGAVTRLPVHASLAYFNPGCGAGESATVSTFNEAGPVSTSITVIDASTGKTTAIPAVTGQVTSSVPVGSGAVAALGNRLVSITTSGKVATLATEHGVPFRLHPDRNGGVAYEVPVGTQAQVRRFAGKASKLLGMGRLSDVQLYATAGSVFVAGPDRANIKLSGLAGWAAVDAPTDTQLSSTGALAVVSVKPVDDKKAPRFDRAAPVKISATVPATHRSATFQLLPAAGRFDAPPRPVLRKTGTAGRASPSLAPVNDPTDPDRGCAIARNDDTQQAYQATAAQVEWAADLAVHEQLTITRPTNFRDSGTASYKIQGPGGIFQLHQLVNGGHMPAQALLGVLAQESNTMHASPHLVDGETGNFNQGGFYGDWSSWDTVDCGYGVGQVTSGMALGETTFSQLQQQAIATDYAANIAASLNMLVDKWNDLYRLGMRANDGDPRFVENWYLAVWAYNTGLQPNANNGNTTGCSPSPTCTDGQNPPHWGLGWLNNPANPTYPADRHTFGIDMDDYKHPNHWPYPEKVMGWAYTPVARYNYVDNAWEPAYQKVSGGDGYPSSTLPGRMAFCVETINDCTPNGTTDDLGTGTAGLCNLDDSHCWWHQPITFVRGPAVTTCASAGCGTEALSYGGNDAEPSRPDVYPANCQTVGLPNDALIVDDTTVPDPVASCPKATSGGSMSWTFAQEPPGQECLSNCITYQSKIDFHQVGGSGYGGHFWFTHTVAPIEQYLVITGKWTLNAPNAWTRLFVHIPAVGAMTHQAAYNIGLPNGEHRIRVIPTSYETNVWVDLGVYDMRGTTDPTVTLSNVTEDGGSNGTGNNDIAWDAIAYQKLTAKPDNFIVALGDSYSSGEGNGDYYHVTNQYGDEPDRREACRRSIHAWARQVTLPGKTQTIGQMADARDPSLSFGFGACSGARTWNMASENEAWSPYGGEAPHGEYGEVPQLDQGLLDENTTLVLLSIGGNDAGFASVAQACGFGSCPNEFSLMDTIHNQVRPRVQEIVTEIRERAPNALIVFAGYPRLFNDGARLDDCGVSLDCQLIHEFHLSVSADECQMLNRLADYMEAQALPNDPAHGVLGVSVEADFAGHAISNWVPIDYINTIQLSAPGPADGEQSPDLTVIPPTNVVGMGSFHPTAAGSKDGYGVAVTRALITA